MAYTPIDLNANPVLGQTVTIDDVVYRQLLVGTSDTISLPDSQITQHFSGSGTSSAVALEGRQSVVVTTSNISDGSATFEVSHDGGISYTNATVYGEPTPGTYVTGDILVNQNGDWMYQDLTGVTHVRVTIFLASGSGDVVIRASATPTTPIGLALAAFGSGQPPLLVIPGSIVVDTGFASSLVSRTSDPASDALGLVVRNVPGASVQQTSDYGPAWTTVRGVNSDGEPFKSTDATSAVACTQAPTTGQKLVITDVFISVDTAMTVTLQEESSNKEIGVFYMAANQTLPAITRSKTKLNVANKKMFVKTSVSGKVSVQSYYYSEA